MKFLSQEGQFYHLLFPACEDIGGSRLFYRDRWSVENEEKSTTTPAVVSMIFIIFQADSFVNSFLNTG